MIKRQFTRRSFLSSAAFGSFSIGLFSGYTTVLKNTAPKTVLFQGDSITDGNRGRSADPNHTMGHGYAFFIAAKLGAEHPDRQMRFINKGNSGDSIHALQVRWQEDAVNLKPDVISILVGINDVLFRIQNGKTAEPAAYEQDLRKLLQDTRQSLPAATIVLGEPFTLPVGMVKTNADAWAKEVGNLQRAVRKLAGEFGCIFIPYQQLFNDAVKRAPADYWIWDGIHPTVSGHGLMAEAWLNKVGKIIAR